MMSPHRPADLAVARARSFVGRGRYALGAGGRDPGAATPESKVGGRPGCDAAGFVAWCLGYDRYQPGFAGAWDWVGPDSMIADAESARAWFDTLPGPEVGALIAYPSIDLERDGRTDRAGHVGLIVEAPALWSRADTAWTAIRVVHCARSLQRRVGHAIDETHGVGWSQRATFRGHAHPRWRTRFLRYLRAS